MLVVVAADRHGARDRAKRQPLHQRGREVPAAAEAARHQDQFGPISRIVALDRDGEATVEVPEACPAADGVAARHVDGTLRRSRVQDIDDSLGAQRRSHGGVAHELRRCDATGLAPRHLHVISPLIERHVSRHDRRGHRGHHYQHRHRPDFDECHRVVSSWRSTLVLPPQKW